MVAWWLGEICFVDDDDDGGNSWVSQIRSWFPQTPRCLGLEVNVGARALNWLGVCRAFKLHGIIKGNPRRWSCGRNRDVIAPFSCPVLCILPAIPAPCSSISECGSIEERLHVTLPIGECTYCTQIKRQANCFI